MSVTINLLPDLRLQRQKDAERRKLVGGVAFLIWVVCAAIIGLLLLIISSQTLLINKTKNDIQTKKTQLQNLDGLGDALSAQARLQSFALLASQRTAMTKLFGILTVAAPSNLQITAFKYDATSKQLTMAGTVKTYAEAAKLVKALEVAHTLGQGSTATSPYFTNVTLTAASRTAASVDFAITATVSSGATSNGSN